MATNDVQERWFRNAPGRAMDPDNVHGLQCVDPPKDYAEALFPGEPWQTTIGAGNAEDMFAGANDKYFRKIRNDPDRPGLIPRRGDIIVWGGTPPGGLNQWGHIAIVLSATKQGVTVLQQDGFLRVPCFKDTLGYWNAGTGMVTGWLRPRLEKAATITPKLAPHQRQTGRISRVAYRTHPADNADLIEWFPTETIYDFKGYVHGEDVGGNDVWFVGAYSGGYTWSGGYTDASTDGLKDLTKGTSFQGANPQVIEELEPYQRVTGKQDVVNYRTGPGTIYGKMKSVNGGQLDTDTIYDFDAWTHGEPVNKNDVWFRGRYSGGWAWSGGFTSQSTNGLEFLETEDKGGTAPEPAPDEYTFKADLACVTRVEPARVGHFKADGLPDTPKGCIWHEFNAGPDRLDVHISSVISWFQSEDNEGFTSAHFAVEGDEIVQLVQLTDRAYHAGAPGNDYVGVETYSGQDPKTIASMIRLRKELDEHFGTRLRPELHKNVLPTLCGTNIDLDAIAYGKDTPEHTKPEPVEPPQDPKQGTAEEFLEWALESFRADTKEEAK